MDDEVHTLHGRIDDAQLLHGERKRAFEELFIEILDDSLLALQIVYAAHIRPHRLIELLQHFGIFLESLLLQKVYHALHGTAHGVVVHELVIGKQRIEHRTGDDVLRQHLDGLCRIHGRVKVSLQPLEVFVERLFVYAGLDELGYALDELVRDKSDFLCPVFPIEAVAALLHELGIHAVLQLTEAKLQLPGDFRVLHLPRFFLSLLKAQSRPADGDGRCIGLLVGFLLVERNLVHHRIETVVVRAQRVQDFPNHIKGLAVVECFFC